MRALALALLVSAAGAASAPLLEFTPEEVRAIQTHGPWPPQAQRDPSNRVSGNARAAQFGERLFFESRLAARGDISCATCHLPERAWQDGRAVALGAAEVDRNTPSLLNVRWQRWFGWDGAGDSLWAQSLRPLLDAREMDSGAARALALVRGDAELSCSYRRAFGVEPPADDAQLLAAIGKTLAAFQETLTSGATPFDAFREALARGDTSAAANYPLAAQRGLRLFVGRGACRLCHVGPLFSNGEFHDIGVPHFIRGKLVDAGRHGGIQRLQANPYNLLGRHSDARNRGTATKTRHLALEHRHFGEFKVPGLRNVAFTAPYMHNGSLATLTAVVRHYSELNLERLHAEGDTLLRPLRLSDAEIADLVAFLGSLSEVSAAPASRQPLAPCVSAARGSRRSPRG